MVISVLHSDEHALFEYCIYFCYILDILIRLAIDDYQVCLLAGGGPVDSIAAFVAGLLLYIYVLKISVPYLSKIVGNIFGGMLVVLMSLACYHIGLGINLSYMISGTIMPLVPGVAFTNGIRDIANGDYISGAVRLLDAILIFLCIAIGMGAVFMVYHTLTGGVMP